MTKKFSKFLSAALVLFHLPDILLIAYFFTLYRQRENIGEHGLIYVAVGLAAYFFIRIVIIAAGGNFFYTRRVRVIRGIIEQFKKGRFVSQDTDIVGDDGLAAVLKELVMVGKHLDNLVSTQRDEIDKFHELYQNIVFSISSSYREILGN